MRMTITNNDANDIYQEGVFAGWFETDAAAALNTSRSNSSTRWSTTYLTRKGRLVICHFTQWQGESDTCRTASLEDMIAVTDVGDAYGEITQAIAAGEDFSKELRKSLAKLLSELEVMLEATEV